MEFVRGIISKGRNCGNCPWNNKDPNHVTECPVYGVQLEYFMEPPWSDFRCDDCKRDFPYGGKVVMIANEKTKVRVTQKEIDAAIESEQKKYAVLDASHLTKEE